MSGRTGRYERLEKAIGYKFADEALLSRALTHSSYANEINQRRIGKSRADGPALHNEMLEFLGDSILGFVAAEILFMRDAGENEGKMTRKRAAIICERSLADGARAISLGEYLLLGSNMDKGQGTALNSILSDAMEALFAAVYIDGGIDAARGVIKRCLGKAIDEAMSQKKIIDYKSRIQEYYFSVDKNVRIIYSVVSESGPAHRRSFISQIAVNGAVLGEGAGGTKKESEQNAAKAALLGISDFKDD